MSAENASFPPGFHCFILYRTLPAFYKNRPLSTFLH